MGAGDILKELLINEGASEVGFSFVKNALSGSLIENEKAICGMDYAITITLKLSDAIIDGIYKGPTYAYFHHYRTVNTFIDRLILRAGLFIENSGYRYIPVAASQSINGKKGLFQHKTAARLSGLGTIGKSGLFISHKYGTRVRLGTLITNMPLDVEQYIHHDCGNCNICTKLCPAFAISGQNFDIFNPNKILIDANACSHHMKQDYSHIGRGAVCGICIANCPKNQKNIEVKE